MRLFELIAVGFGRREVPGIEAASVEPATAREPRSGDDDSSGVVVAAHLGDKAAARLQRPPHAGEHRLLIPHSNGARRLRIRPSNTLVKINFWPSMIRREAEARQVQGWRSDDGGNRTARWSAERYAETAHFVPAPRRSRPRNGSRHPQARRISILGCATAVLDREDRLGRRYVIAVDAGPATWSPPHGARDVPGSWTARS